MVVLVCVLLQLVLFSVWLGVHAATWSRMLRWMAVIWGWIWVLATATTVIMKGSEFVTYMLYAGACAVGCVACIGAGSLALGLRRRQRA